MARKKVKKANKLSRLWSWLQLKGLNSWSLLKRHASCEDMWKGVGLVAAGGLLVLGGSLECALSFLLIGWGILELVDHFRWH